MDNYQNDCRNFKNRLNCEVKMMKNSKMLTIVLSLIFGIIAISPVQADIGEMIQAGIDYLEANQDPTSGLWGTDKETPYRDGREDSRSGSGMTVCWDYWWRQVACPEA